MTAATWQVSGMFVGSLADALKRERLFDAVAARLEPEAQALLRTPHQKSWWPAAPFLSLLDAMEAVGGTGTVRRAGSDASHRRMGGVVRPLAGVLLAMSKTPLLALLSRLGTFVSAGILGVDARVQTDLAARRAEVRFEFPEEVPGLVCELWYGLFEEGFSLAREGRLERTHVEPRVHHFTVAW